MFTQNKKNQRIIFQLISYAAFENFLVLFVEK